MKDQPQHSAGNHFSDPYGQHHERDGKRQHIAIFQYKRYNEHICDDRWKWRQIFAFIAQRPCKYRADQGGEASEDNIRKDAAAEDIAEKASYK